MTAVIVLAQGRTGTSTVAGVLHHLGVYMGDGLLPWTPDNAKGSFEDAQLRELNVSTVGGNWKKPFDLLGAMDDKAALLKPAYQKLLERFGEHELWGFKDPLLCFTLPFFADLLPEDTRFITPLRPPDAAIKSVAAMPDVASLSEAQTIFWRYTDALIETEMGLDIGWPRLRVYYDRLVESPKEHVAKIAAFCGLYPNQDAVDFVDAKLRHWK